MLGAALVLVLAGSSALASCRLFLKSGEVISADGMPEIRGDSVHFLRSGVSFSIPLARVDWPRTQTAALRPAPEPAREAPDSLAPGKPRLYTDEDVREAPPPAESSPASSEPEEEGAQTAPGGAANPAGRPATATGTLDALYSREKVLEGLRVKQEDRLAEVRSRHEAFLRQVEQESGQYRNDTQDPRATEAYWAWRRSVEVRRGNLQLEMDAATRTLEKTLRDLREVRSQILEIYSPSKGAPRSL